MNPAHSLPRCVAVSGALLLAASTAEAQTAPAWAPALDSVVNAALASSRAPGATVAVVSNGQLVYAKGYGLANVETKQPMTADMLLRVGSVTKMFTGATLASLVEDKLLDMDKPISTYVPSLAGKRVGTVTTQQLMTHSAGWLDNAVAYGRMGEGALGEVMREVSDTMFFTDAGRTFSYSNPSISMAGYVAEMAGKKRYAAAPGGDEAQHLQAARGAHVAHGHGAPGERTERPARHRAPDDGEHGAMGGGLSLLERTGTRPLHHGAHELGGP